MSQHRYPGAQPFTTTQENIFFGRESDIEDLYRQIKLEPLVVLYSKSGLGKSSLLNAGIVPRIQEEGRYLPVNIRFNAYNQQVEGTVSPEQTTFESIKLACDCDEQNTFIDDFLPAENTLWYLLKKEQAFTSNRRQFLLIFDQFEELFTYPEAGLLNFKIQMEEVMHTQIPHRFREIVEAEVENPARLNAEQLALLHQPFETKIVFAIRSDRMSLLDKIADRLPLVKRSWYELDALNEEQAEDAILNPAYKKGSFLSPIFDYDDKAIEKILDFLTQGRSQKIESFQLQILCQAIERKVIQNKLSLVTEADLGNIQDIYENYYEDQINLLDDPAERLAARRLIEEGLIFEEEERRLSLYEGQIFAQFQLSEVLLRKLEDTHLIRREPSMKGGYTYELSHDTLVAPVLKAKARRQEKEGREQAEAERLRQEQELATAQQKAEQEKQLRQQAEQNEARARQRTRLAAIISIIALGVSILAFWQYTRAQAEKQKANDNLELAEQREKEAQINLDRAEQEEKRAQTNADSALAARQLAEKNLGLAQQREQEAQEAQRATQNALSDLKTASARAVSLLLNEVDRHILQLDYRAALEKSVAALELGEEKQAIQKRLLELAYFYTETGKLDTAIQCLSAFLPKAALPKAQRETLLQAIENTDSRLFQSLQLRYYPDLVDIPGGTFMMGCDTLRDNRCDDDELPAHPVTLDAYQIARSETTVWQYHLFVGATGRAMPETPTWQWSGDNPIVNVGWYDAVTYANWASQQMGLDPVYQLDSIPNNPNDLYEMKVDWSGITNWQANGLRLPTEAEWEYAARGGSRQDTFIYSGSNNMDEVGWYYGNSNSRTHAVMQKQANRLGVYDMSGNVWEWCWDWYGEYSDGPLSNYTGAETGNYRVLRGGSWYNYGGHCRASNRLRDVPDGRYDVIGFRLSRAL